MRDGKLGIKKDATCGTNDEAKHGIDNNRKIRHYFGCKTWHCIGSKIWCNNRRIFGVILVAKHDAKRKQKMVQIWKQKLAHIWM